MIQRAFFLFLLISISCIGEIKSETKAIPDIGKIPLPENGFYCCFLDSKGILWFGSRGNGIFKYDKNVFTNYSTKDGLSNNDITSIAEDRKGNMWFGTNDGACRFDGTNFSHLDIPKSDTSSRWLDKVYPVVNPNQVMSILEDKHSNIWLGTNGAGVYRYDGKTFQQFLANIGMFYEDDQQHNIVLSMVEDLSGNIWFSSLSHGGVSVYNGKEFTHYVDELSDDFIRVVYCDSKGKIWIGTHGNHQGGLDYFDGEKFSSYYKTKDGFSHNNVFNIYEDKDGHFWIGSGTTALSIFDGKHFKVFEGKDGQTYDKMIFVIGDSQGHIWFGNRTGLWRFDGVDIIQMTER